MTSLRLRPARPARLLQNLRRQPSKRRRPTMLRRRRRRGRQPVRPARLAQRRPNQSRRRNLRPPRRSFRRPPQSRRLRTRRRSQRLSRLLPNRLRRSRLTCRRREPRRRRARRSRRVPRRQCRRRGGSSPRAVKSRHGRFCRRPDGRRSVRPKRPRPRARRPKTGPEPRRRLACPCRRNLPTVGRSRPRRRHLVRGPASRFPRRQVLPARLPAAAARTAQAPPAASGAPQEAATGRTEAGPVAGARTLGLRRPPAAVQAAPPAALVREGREVHHEAVREADRAGVGAVSAKNCSPSSSLRTPRSMRPSPMARSSSSGDRRPKMSLPG